jgi:amino acid adenylation domain-containing protein
MIAMHDETLCGFRLSPQQSRLWLAQQGGTALVAQASYLLAGPLDAETLRQALYRAIERHEVLRTTFHRQPGMRLPLQVIDETAAAHWTTADLSSSADPEQAARLAELARTETRQPIDFARAPLVRALLATLAPEQHVLLLTLPALCADALSLEILGRELAHFCGGSGIELVEEPLQYADFSEWQNQLLEADDTEARASKSYWSRPELAAPPTLTLPLQVKVDPEAAFVPESLTVGIPETLAERVEALAQTRGATLAAFLLACWQALLKRLSGVQEVAVGVVGHARKQEELQGAVGLFSEALPVVVRPENTSLEDLVARAQSGLTDIWKWQEYYTAPEGVRFDAIFELLPRPEKLQAGQATLMVERMTADQGRFTLKLSCRRGEQGLEVAFRYDPQVLKAEDVQRMASYFEHLLDAAVANPRTAVGSLEILSDSQRRQLADDGNRTAADYPRQCVHELFAKQAARTPNWPALAFEGVQWTYAELNGRANQLAHHLRGRGVGRNVCVGLCLERSADMILGVLGILKAGGAYVPLSPDLPQARLAQLLTATTAPVVLTHERLLDRVVGLPAQPLCLDGAWVAWNQEPSCDPDCINSPDDRVYVIFTSGSTGTPKGVAVRHRNLVNYSHFIQGKLGADKIDPGLHFASVSTLSADLGNTCVFPALLSGGCLHVLGYDTAMDAGRFARYAAEHPIDVLKITPSHLSALLSAPEGPAVLPRKFLFLGGEAFSWQLLDRIRAAGTCSVINHYGPTETTVGSLTFDVDGQPEARKVAETVPIGRPIANTRVYLLDPQGNPVPLGVAGELVIGGDGVAEGYLNDPQQTAERFVRDPFAPDPEARMYRTGDRARRLADGSVEFLGRLDQQVKIRGFRVEPGEVEVVLRHHPGVGEAVVVARQDKHGEKQLAAYFVLAYPHAATADQLASWVREHLPDFMVPAAFVRLASLPLTPNGKVDRKALPEPDQAAGRLKEYVAPRDTVEEELAAIWADVLDLERVGALDDFFDDLGGHSLLATQMISRIRIALDVQLPLRSVFEKRTIAALAEVIRGLRGEEPTEGDMQDLLNELKGLSEEEVRGLLAADGPPEGR